MKNKISILLLLALFTLTQVSKAQDFSSGDVFAKKFWLYALGGTMVPVGLKIDGDSLPTVFPNFNNGVQLGVGFQYNPNARWVLALNVMNFLSFNYKNPLPNASNAKVEEEKLKNGFNSYFSNTSIGIEGRYKFIPLKKFNPYLLAELSGNYYLAEIEPRLGYFEQSRVGNVDFGDDIVRDKYTLLRFDAKKIEPSIAFGTKFGIGCDYKLNENIILFLQGTYSTIFTQSNLLLKSNCNFISIQAGVRFGLVKSKSIL